MQITISVDGPSASGKGTLAKRIAEHLNFHYLDTGLLYRAIALKDGDPILAAKAITPEDLLEPKLRSMHVARKASKVAAVPEVRAALLKYQQEFALREPGAVLDGRDIGTCVCPNAQIKLFIEASLSVRAERRAKELGLDHKSTLIDLEARDARDRFRPVSPLRPAPGSYIIDTTNLNADQAFRIAISYIEKAQERVKKSDKE